VKLGNENGATSKLEVLSAEVDLNNDSLAIENLITATEKQKAALNVLMGRDPKTSFNISTNIEVPAEISIADTERKALQNNSSLLLAQVSQTLAANQAAIANGGRMPTLSASGAYGFNGGLTLSMPVFNGNQLTTAMKNADIAEQNSALELAKAKLTIRNQLYTAELDSKLITRTLKAQEENVTLAELALQRAQSNYSNGQVSFNDLRVAQLNVLIAKNSVNQAKINLVKLYYTVSRLGGGLLTN
jgi:outer membrane protein TolC